LVRTAHSGWGATELSKIDSAIYKIALAGFLHDIGKFIQRANFLTKEQINDLYNHHANRILPFNKTEKRHTHQHALYTAWFIQWFEKHLKQISEKLKTGEDFLNLSAKHHKPETPLQWIVAMADRVASGFDRDKFENYNLEKGIRDYRKTQLLTIFEQIFSKKKEISEFKFRYPLKKLSPENIFPEKAGESDEEEYKKLFENFLNDLRELEHTDDIALWFESFDGLFQVYASHIPAATVGSIIPDVSLYDHCKITSALTCALYLYHIHTDTMKVEEIKDEETKKILIVSGDFYGIQNFIFSEGGETNKNSAKLLRGRSFVVSLFSELCADFLCREIGLPSVSIILNTAGKFTMLLPNTGEVREKIRAVEEKINDWFIEKFYGEVSVGFAFVEASLSDFHTKDKRFLELWKAIHEKIEEKKFKKINLDKYGGVRCDYLRTFSEKGICKFCGRRPAFDLEEGNAICGICKDQIFIGKNLVKKQRIAITTKDASLNEKLEEPIFGFYQVSFPSGKLIELEKNGQLLKHWDILISEKGEVSKKITPKFINGYVPDENGLIKTFEQISKAALSEKNTGIEALGVLKADLDNLGKIFAFGFEKTATLSRYATLSRQINNFFCIWLPYLLKTDERFKDIYTVFSGGDDLFLIGPYNRVIELAGFLNRRIKEYFCENPSFTISAGISINKPCESIRVIGERAEEFLQNSKNNNRNSITLFSKTVKWDGFYELQKIKDEIYNWYNEGVINKAMLYRLLELCRMAEKELKVFEKKDEISLRELDTLKWRALLKYTISRNVTKSEKVKNISEKLAQWIDRYRGSMVIPLSQIIYDVRGG